MHALHEWWKGCSLHARSAIQLIATLLCVSIMLIVAVTSFEAEMNRMNTEHERELARQRYITQHGTYAMGAEESPGSSCAYCAGGDSQQGSAGNR